MKNHQRFLQVAVLGIVVSVSSGIIQATSAAAAPRTGTLVSGPTEPVAAGNPCKDNKDTKACRDWILGNPKPPIRPK